MEDKPKDVLCAGILVADLFVPPLDRLPSEGELVKVDGMLLTTGGCAANTGVDLARLGVRAGIAGKVGNDIFGDFVIRDLESKGLADVSGVRRSRTRATAQTVILPVKGQDRRFITCVGANGDFTVADIDMQQLAAARVLYVGGYFMIPGLDPQSLRKLFEYARSHAVRTVLDVAGVDPEGGLEVLRPALPFTDAFLPNDDEARLLTGESDPVRQAEIFTDLGAGTAVVTLGERGLVARSGARSYRAEAFKVPFVDASGSGDAFDAGFIVGMMEGWDLKRTLAFASAIGASCCTRLGCTAGVFTRKQADQFLAGRPFNLSEL